MNPLQRREEEIFRTLKSIRKDEFVIIGGYAVNTYTLPRFSIDCDIVTKDKKEAEMIGEDLLRTGYKKVRGKGNDFYFGNFIRYDKIITKNFVVSMDIMYKSVHDRQTQSEFSAEWIFNNSSVKALKGKTITDHIKARIINIDALLVMKVISARSADIRDAFMLMPKAKNKHWIKEEILARCSFNERINIVKEKIISKNFKNNLQGVYGYVDERLFDKHRKSILTF